MCEDIHPRAQLFTNPKYPREVSEVYFILVVTFIKSSGQAVRRHGLRSPKVSTQALPKLRRPQGKVLREGNA